MGDNKKVNIVLIIFVMVLLLICVGMGIFIFMNKDKKGEKEEQNQNEQVEKIDQTDEVTELDINDTLVQSLYKMTQSEYDKCGYLNQPLSLENVGDKLNSYNMTDDYKGKIIYDYVLPSKEISEDNMKKAYEKVFGPNTYKVMNTIYFHALGNINYDSNNKKYILTFEPEETWPCVTHLYNKEVIINAVKNKNSIKITTAYVFNGHFKLDLYKDPKEKEPLGVAMSLSDEEAISYIKEHKDELHQLTYTFTKADDKNYYYSEVERTK